MLTLLYASIGGREGRKVEMSILYMTNESTLVTADELGNFLAIDSFVTMYITIVMNKIN